MPLSHGLSSTNGCGHGKCSCKSLRSLISSSLIFFASYFQLCLPCCLGLSLGFYQDRVLPLIRYMYMANPDLQDIYLDSSIITISVLRIFESWVSLHVISWDTSIYTRLAAIHDQISCVDAVVLCNLDTEVVSVSWVPIGSFYRCN